MNDIWFMNEQHKNNYKELSVRFPNVADDLEYASACYLAAVPVVFESFSISEVEQGPFDWFFNEVEEGSIRLHKLTDYMGDYYLVEAGAHFWNGYEFRLKNAVYFWTEEYFKVFTQACKLSKKRA